LPTIPSLEQSTICLPKPNRLFHQLETLKGVSVATLGPSC